jgi:hypothetical protein
VETKSVCPGRCKAARFFPIGNEFIGTTSTDPVSVILDLGGAESAEGVE